MKRRLIYALCIMSTVLGLAACHKDKFQTKPTLSVKEINNTDVPAPDGTLRITLECTDKEGDGGGGQLTYIRVRTNSTAYPILPTTIRLTLPMLQSLIFQQKTKLKLRWIFPITFLMKTRP